MRFDIEFLLLYYKEKTIEHSIPEELDHAKRLEEAMKACNIEF